MHHKSLIAIVIIFISCTNPFAPKLVNENLLTSSFLTDLKTPKDVLTNFRYAYNFQDSLIYSELLDSSFTFVYDNYDEFEPFRDHWERDEDLRTTARLFRHFQDINLTWGTMFSDTLDNENIKIAVSFSLTFNGGNIIPTLSGRALFYFVKKKSGKWKIVRWEDTQSF